MRRNRSLAVPILLLLFAVGLSACSPSGTGAGITVRVVATQNFGQELMFDETLEVPQRTSAMEALQQVADIETTYGGGFVNAIDGVRSGYTGSHEAKKDWFICANGILTM